MAFVTVLDRCVLKLRVPADERRASADGRPPGAPPSSEAAAGAPSAQPAEAAVPREGGPSSGPLEIDSEGKLLEPEGRAAPHPPPQPDSQ